MDLEALERSAKFIKFLLIKTARRVYQNWTPMRLGSDTKKDVDFVQLSLARAMAYWTNKEKTELMSYWVLRLSEILDKIVWMLLT